MGESVGVLLGTNLPGGAQQKIKRKVAVRKNGSFFFEFDFLLKLLMSVLQIKL